MESQPIAPRLVNKKQLAEEVLGVSPRLVDMKVAEGEIPFIRLGRRILFDPFEVVACLKEGRNQNTKK